jgi:hypothetical protein
MESWTNESYWNFDRTSYQLEQSIKKKKSIRRRRIGFIVMIVTLLLIGNAVNQIKAAPMIAKENAKINYNVYLAKLAYAKNITMTDYCLSLASNNKNPYAYETSSKCLRGVINGTSTKATIKKAMIVQVDLSNYKPKVIKLN